MNRLPYARVTHVSVFNHLSDLLIPVYDRSVISPKFVSKCASRFSARPWRIPRSRSELYGQTLAFDFKCPDRGKGKGNFEAPFSRFPELFRTRSRLYRSQILQVNTRWKALVKIYTMHSFAPFFNLKIFVKNR